MEKQFKECLSLTQEINSLFKNKIIEDLNILGIKAKNKMTFEVIDILYYKHKDLIDTNPEYIISCIELLKI